MQFIVANERCASLDADHNKLKGESMNIRVTTSNEKPSILIVDDMAANVRLLTSILGEEAYTVYSATSGEHALRFLESSLPDLILLDIRMPGLDGYQVCERLKSSERTRDIPVIFISAADDVSDKVKAFSLGGVDYIVKPVQVDEVLARISTHLSLRNIQKHLQTNAQERAADLVNVHARLNEEISERQRSEALRAGQSRILEMIATSTPLEEVLTSLTLLIESQLEGVMCCVLLPDEGGTRVRRGIASSLSETFIKSLEGLVIGPKAGSSGTAMYRGEPVIVADILNDPLWDEYRHLTMPYGLRACWSLPILSHEDTMLGAFTMYSREAREPTSVEMQLTDVAVRIAGIAIERKETEERIRYMAQHDVLTGLPNSSLLEDRLEQAMLFAQRYNRSVTVATVGLDNFKLINDSLGREAGDELLRIVATRLSDGIRRTDTVVRMGGDEFVVVLFDQTEKADVITPTLQKIRDAIAQPIQISEHHFHITCSIGLSTYPSDGRDTETLLRNANVALARAKELGRNNFQFYTSEMNTEIHERLVMQEGLRNALVQGEFHLLYQPQADLKSGRIIGVEALIRWHHPELGIVSPARFIPLAEETGLIVPIGNWVLTTACKQNKAWQNAGLRPITMSVNVSARQFMEKDLVHRVSEALAEGELEAEWLELELTESLVMKDVQRAVSTMAELQSIGINLAIDDFGTGYSSLSALKHFPIVRLKIDQSFVRNIPHDQNDRAIASAMVALGHRLDLKVIAEGVESEEQRVFLRDNNCDEMQGFHLSRPVPADEVEKLLRAQVAERKVQ